jgi:oxaloacetate decarboxylase gamma subunit
MIYFAGLCGVKRGYMTIFDMLGQSGILTILGMGVVYGFLIIMVITISVVGKIIMKSGLKKDVQPAGSVIQRPAVNNDGITAAIGAAVNEYRKKSLI